MDDAEPGAILASEPRGIVEHGTASRRKVHGAKNALAGDNFRRCGFRMDGRPDRTLEIMEHLGRDRAEKVTAEIAKSVGRQHQQIRVPR